MFLGIDLHDHEAQVAVVDDDGNLQDEIRLPTNRLNELAEEYAGSEAAIEASGNYRAAYEMLGASRCNGSEPIKEPGDRRCHSQD